jgi:hypothetical protein
MRAHEVASALALYGVPPLAVAVANPAARHHLGAVTTGVFVGGFAGRIAAGFLPADEQTVTSEATAAILGSVVGGFAAYFLATRGERRVVPVKATTTRRRR